MNAGSWKTRLTSKTCNINITSIEMYFKLTEGNAQNNKQKQSCNYLISHTSNYLRFVIKCQLCNTAQKHHTGAQREQMYNTWVHHHDTWLFTVHFGSMVLYLSRSAYGVSGCFVDGNELKRVTVSTSTSWQWVGMSGVSSAWMAIKSAIFTSSRI